LTQSGSKPLAARWLAIPWAITSSSSMMRTFGILSRDDAAFSGVAVVKKW
jgi:hypothetical protein